MEPSWRAVHNATHDDKKPFPPQQRTNREHRQTEDYFLPGFCHQPLVESGHGQPGGSGECHFRGRSGSRVLDVGDGAAGGKYGIHGSHAGTALQAARQGEFLRRTCLLHEVWPEASVDGRAVCLPHHLRLRPFQPDCAEQHALRCHRKLLPHPHGICGWRSDFADACHHLRRHPSHCPLLCDDCSLHGFRLHSAGALHSCRERDGDSRHAEPHRAKCFRMGAGGRGSCGHRRDARREARPLLERSG